MSSIGRGSSTQGRTCRCIVLTLPNWTLNLPAFICVCQGRLRNVTKRFLDFDAVVVEREEDVGAGVGVHDRLEGDLGLTDLEGGRRLHGIVSRRGQEVADQGDRGVEEGRIDDRRGSRGWRRCLGRRWLGCRCGLRLRRGCRRGRRRGGGRGFLRPTLPPPRPTRLRQVRDGNGRSWDLLQRTRFRTRGRPAPALRRATSVREASGRKVPGRSVGHAGGNRRTGSPRTSERLRGRTRPGARPRPLHG